MATVGFTERDDDAFGTDFEGTEVVDVADFAGGATSEGAAVTFDSFTFDSFFDLIDVARAAEPLGAADFFAGAEDEGATVDLLRGATEGAIAVFFAGTTDDTATSSRFLFKPIGALASNFSTLTSSLFPFLPSKTFSSFFSSFSSSSSSSSPSSSSSLSSSENPYLFFAWMCKMHILRHFYLEFL